MASNPAKQWETLAEAAIRVGCDPSRLRQLALSGNLSKAVKFGRNWFVPRGYKIVLDKHSR